MDPLPLLAEPSRARIMQLIWARELPAGDIAAAMPITFGAVSQHLALLHEAGLVSLRKQGRHRFYAANRAALGPLAAALEQMWFGKLAELKRLAEAEQARIDTAAAAKKPARPRRAHPAGSPRSRSRRKPR